MMKFLILALALFVALAHGGYHKKGYGVGHKRIYGVDSSEEDYMPRRYGSHEKEDDLPRRYGGRKYGKTHYGGY